MTKRNDIERARKLALIAHAIALYEERERRLSYPGEAHTDALCAIIGILGDTCSICRRRHGWEIEHAAE